jgi:hypothetical protein
MKYVITLCVYQINRKVIKRSRIMMVGFLIGHVV